MKKVLIINGPNLNMLGKREPSVYGSKTLEEIEREVAAHCFEKNVKLEFFQSNHEGEIVDKIQKFDGGALIINAGALTHYSYSIADALKAKNCFKVELHISNIFAREQFRHTSVLSGVCDACMCGFGTDGYIMAVEAAVNK